MDAFKDANVEFEKISRIEPWAVDLLLNLEHYITEQQHAAPDVLGDNDEKKDDGDYNNNNNNDKNGNQADNTNTGGGAPAFNPFSQGDQAPDANAPDLDDL